MACVDPDDLACRESQLVEEYYRADWFYFEPGATLFNAPAFYLKDNRAFFINGRHRTVLLARHLSLLPMALTQIDAASEATREYRRAAAHRRRRNRIAKSTHRWQARELPLPSVKPPNSSSSGRVASCACQRRST